MSTSEAVVEPINHQWGLFLAAAGIYPTDLNDKALRNAAQTLLGQNADVRHLIGADGKLKPLSHEDLVPGRNAMTKALMAEAERKGRDFKVSYRPLSVIHPQGPSGDPQLWFLSVLAKSRPAKSEG